MRTTEVVEVSTDSGIVKLSIDQSVFLMSSRSHCTSSAISGFPLLESNLSAGDTPKLAEAVS
jgi:hypothetical protein